MNKAPKVLSSKIVAKTRIFTVEQMEIAFSNGNTSIFERIKGSEKGAVLIVPLLDTNTVLLTREYAAGVNRYELGLPKGGIDGDETLLEAANRELMEEAGYGAHKLDHLISFTTSPAYINSETHVVLAQQLYEKRLPGDEPETIEVIPWRFTDLNTLLSKEECTEARSIAALYYVRDYLNNSGN